MLSLMVLFLPMQIIILCRATVFLLKQGWGALLLYFILVPVEYKPLEEIMRAQ
jgi:hypothetical protein